MANLEARIRMAAESILENEALRSGLNDDEAARSLLDWGVSWAATLAQQTADIEDDEEADQAAYPRMRALRGMLTALKDLSVAEGWTRDSTRQTLETALGCARVLHGQTWQPPGDFEQKVAVILQTVDPRARLNALIGLMGGPSAPAQQNPDPSKPVSDGGKSPQQEGFLGRFFRRLRGG